jgi:Family of unknown function (DUF6412)
MSARVKPKLETAARGSGPLALVALLAGLVQVAGHVLATPSGVMAVAAAVVATTVVAGVAAAVLALGAHASRAAARGPLISRAAALRKKSWSAAFLRLRDPDAAGRRRPRAPSAAPAAA